MGWLPVMSTNFSMIIPYKERHPDRRKTILSILDYYSPFVKSNNFEILIMEQWQPTLRDIDYPVRYFFLGNSGDFNKSWGMNIGALQAKSNSLVFCDADALISIDNLVESVENLKQYEAVNPMGMLYDLPPGVFQPTKEGTLSKRPGLTFASTISVFRKDAFLKIRGWDEDCTVWGAEDDIMSIMIREFLTNVSLDFDVFHLYHSDCPRDLSEHNFAILREVWKIGEDKNALLKRYRNRIIGRLNKYGPLNLVEINKIK